MISHIDRLRKERDTLEKQRKAAGVEDGRAWAERAQYWLLDEMCATYSEWCEAPAGYDDWYEAGFHDHLDGQAHEALQQAYRERFDRQPPWNGRIPIEYVLGFLEGATEVYAAV